MAIRIGARVGAKLRDVVARVCQPGGERERTEIRRAIRKEVPAEQWSTFVRTLCETLHPRDAIAVLSAGRIVRPVEGIEEAILIHTETRSANMRIQAASKEPWTYQWIRCAVQPGDTFYDVGANVGVYSLMALARGAAIVAFEPHHESFRDLCRNLVLNQITDNATVLPLALSDRRNTMVNSGLAGPAGQTMSLTQGQVGIQSILSARLDDAIAELGLPVPNHMKIDVDGYELEVLLGAETALASPSLRSVLIEVDVRTDGQADRTKQVTGLLAGKDFTMFDVANPMAEGVNYFLGTRGAAAAPLREALNRQGIVLEVAA